MFLKFVNVAIALLFAAGPVQAAEKADTNRHEEILRRGAQVMPFNLARTVHIFEKTKSGGIQQVIVKDADTDQIRLIRMHLSEIAKEFAQRDFSDPASIHGKDMPGLARLEKSRPDELKITYSEIDKGAQIEYTSDKPDVIDAVHRWFDAQLADHAGALPGPDKQ